MAATFVVEDGTGKTNANSYSSEADADQYHENHGNPAIWVALSTVDKEYHLREGTQYLDAVYSPKWLGTRASSLQALDHPRINVLDRDNYLRSSTIVFQEAKDATAIAALKSAEAAAATPATTIIPDLTNPGTESARTVKVGPITKSVQYTGGNAPTKRYRLIDLTIGPIITSSSLVRRG